MSKILVIICVLLLLLIGAGVYNLIRDFPVNVQIIEGPKEITIYVEPHSNIPTQGLNIIMPRGTTEIKTLIVKNTGIENLNLNVSTTNITWGDISLNPTYFTLLPDASESITMTLYVYPYTNTSNQSFSILFYEE